MYWTLLACLLTCANIAAMSIQWAKNNPKLDDSPQSYGRDYPEY